MQTVCFSETFVSTCESTRRHNPVEQHRHPHHRENLTPPNMKFNPLKPKQILFRYIFGCEGFQAVPSVPSGKCRLKRR
jgi:hypothetical protein